MFYFSFYEVLSLASVSFLVLIPWVLVAITLFDAVRRPASDWRRADQDQMLWTIVILSGGFIPVIGPVAYLLTARPRLRAITGRPLADSAQTEPSSVGAGVR